MINADATIVKVKKMKADQRALLKILVVENEKFTRSMNMLAGQNKESCATNINEMDSAYSFMKTTLLVRVYRRAHSLAKHVKKLIIAKTYIGMDRRSLRSDIPFTGKDRRQPEMDIEEYPGISISKEERDVLLAA